jgi:hypothetical protein
MDIKYQHSNEQLELFNKAKWEVDEGKKFVEKERRKMEAERRNMELREQQLLAKVNESQKQIQKEMELREQLLQDKLQDSQKQIQKEVQDKELLKVSLAKEMNDKKAIVWELNQIRDQETSKGETSRLRSLRSNTKSKAAKPNRRIDAIKEERRLKETKELAEEGVVHYPSTMDDGHESLWNVYDNPSVVYDNSSVDNSASNSYVSAFSNFTNTIQDKINELGVGPVMLWNNNDSVHLIPESVTTETKKKARLGRVTEEMKVDKDL